MPRMTGNRYFAEAVRASGTTHVFFVPTIMIPAMAEMEDMDIRRVVTHGEKAAAYMADGYARASHHPGICLAQTIGSANLAAGLRDAYMACSPVVALTGGVDAGSRYKHLYQEIEDFPMWEQVTKGNFHVDAVERFPDLLRQAFRVATSLAPGPVHLEMSGTHAQVLECEAELTPFVEQRFMQVPAFRPEPEADAVRAAANMLAQAERPVIIAGGGVNWSGAEAELMKLAELLQIPVATSLNAKAALLDDHALNVGVPGTYSRWCANRVISEADLVFFIGSHTGGQVTTNWQVPWPGIAAIQLDIDPEELGRSYPLQVALLGDAKVTLQKLIDSLQAAAPRQKWLDRVQSLVREYQEESDQVRNSDAVPIRGQQRGRATEMWHFDHQVNLAQVAEAMGCVGIRVERPEDIRTALDKAIASNRPAIVEVLSDINAISKRAWTPSPAAGH
jgi:acetolactate synthase-1/2/3 large subunit